MTRINTNVSSIVARNTLQRNNNDLQEALTRLSTGLRINKGKDDPAGLIASEVLRSDIVSVKKAITNSERANQLIATADSALGQVSNLLNDIRGLVSEAANTGAMSDEQIAANQLQLDSALEAIDRIAQITQFQGRRLLDGSLDFTTSAIDSTKVADLKIDQANFGALKQIGVSVDVVKQATKAELNYGFGAVADDVVLEVAGTKGTEAFNFAAGSTIQDIAAALNLVSDATGVRAVVETGSTAGSLNVSSFGNNNDIVLTSQQAGFDAGNIRVKYTTDPGDATLGATFTNGANSSDPDTLEIRLATTEWTAAAATFDPAGDNNEFTITSKVKGIDFNGVEIVITAGAAAVGDETFVFDPNAGTNGRLTIDVNAASTTVDLIAALGDSANAEANALFSLTQSADSDGSGTYAAGTLGTLTGGINGGQIISTANDVVELLNNTAAVNSRLSAALASGSNGYGVVTAFQESAYTGTAEANNRLQFLGAEGTRNIIFSSTPGTELGVDVTSNPRVLDFARATTLPTNANAGLVFTARQKGSEFDDITINFTDNGGGDNTVVFDRESKTLTFDVDIAGGTTAADIKALLDSSADASQFFTVNFYGTSDGSGDVTVDDSGAKTSGGVASEGSIIVNLGTNSAGVVTTTANDLIAYFDDPANAALLADLGISISNIEGSDGTGRLSASADPLVFSSAGSSVDTAQASATIHAQNGANGRLTFTAVQSGAAFDDVQIIFEDTATSGNESVVFDENTKTLTFSIEAGTTTADDVRTLLNGDATANQFFTAALATGSDGSATLTAFDGGVTSGGVVVTGTNDGAALIGNEDQANVGLSFVSDTYGSDAFVSVKSLNGANFAVTDFNGAVVPNGRVNGSDVEARVNGIVAVGKGLTAEINTASLDLNFTLQADVEDGESFSFQITGGGAKFQLGPDVVSNQQAYIGIRAVSTARLGGSSGTLFELRSGGVKDLRNDVLGASAVVEEVISEITNLRGRLGAFQRTTLETNIFSLNDALENLTEAESSIRDADFAAESSRLTRAQILVQSSTSVLGIANQNPQNVLSLLR